MEVYSYTLNKLVNLYFSSLMFQLIVYLNLHFRATVNNISSFVVVRNPGRDISFPIFIRKEIETRKLERKSKQKISRLIDLLYRLNDIISR